MTAAETIGSVNTNTTDNVNALNRLLEIATGFWTSQTFFTACQLGVFVALAEAPASPDELAQRLGIPPLACRRLLVPLCALGLVEQKTGVFHNSAIGSYCTSSSSVPLEALSMWGAGTPFYYLWEFLPDAVRELSPRWQQALGAVPEGRITSRPSNRRPWRRSSNTSAGRSSLRNAFASGRSVCATTSQPSSARTSLSNSICGTSSGPRC